MLPHRSFPNFEADWNKPPTSTDVGRCSVGWRYQRIPKMMRWGLLPHWAKDEKNLITRRSTLQVGRLHDEAGISRRLEARASVASSSPTDSYEWKRIAVAVKEKQPYARSLWPTA